MVIYVKAIVLAAGSGTRLRPLTYGIPKPLMPVAGRPAVDYAIDNVLKVDGVDEVLVAVSHMSEAVSNYIKNTRDGNDVRVVHALAMETGGDLKTIAADVGIKERFIVAYGDVITDIDVSSLLKFHEKTGALATVALFEVPWKDVHRFGVVKMDGDLIRSFVEKPKKEDAPSNLANTGYYILEPEVLDYIPLSRVKTEQSAFPKLAEMGKLAGMKVTPSMWVDIGTIQSYIKANKLAELLLPPE